MSNPSPPANSGDVFDVRRIRRLVELMNEHELAEIDLRQADTRIRIRRGPEQVAQVIEPRGVYTPPPAAAAAKPPAAGDGPKSPADAGPTKDYLLIRSPTVGTFYGAPSPGESAFVKIGSTVKPDTAPKVQAAPVKVQEGASLTTPPVRRAAARPVFRSPF